MSKGSHVFVCGLEHQLFDLNQTLIHSFSPLLLDEWFLGLREGKLRNCLIKWKSLHHLNSGNVKTQETTFFVLVMMSVPRTKQSFPEHAERNERKHKRMMIFLIVHVLDVTKTIYRFSIDVSFYLLLAHKYVKTTPTSKTRMVLCRGLVLKSVFRLLRMIWYWR